jgi:DNA invertase Pin-like site-specific DNA recombinase
MRTDLRALCEREGFEIVAEHIDDGLSGAIRDRPQFVGWLDDARNGRADILVAHHVDRMTREGLNVAALLLDVMEGKHPETGKVIRKPVRLMDTKGLDSANGVAFRMMFLIGAESARYERERIKERAIAKYARLRKAGRWPGGPAPYGYRVAPTPDGPGKTLAIEPHEADALRQAANDLLAGENLTSVVRRLNRQGPPPRRAPEWSRVTLRQAITGDHILGRVTLDGKVIRDESGHALTPFPAVLDMPTVTALRALLNPQPDGRKKPGRKPTRLLSRLLECFACHGVLQVAHRTNGEIAYRCQRNADGGNCKQPVVVSALPIEAYVTGEFLKGAAHMPVFERVAIVTGGEALATLDDAIAATLTELGTKATAEAFARLTQLQADRDALAAEPQGVQVEMRPTGRTMLDEWEGRDTDGRRALLAEATLALVLKPGKRGPRGFDPARLDIHWQQDTDPDAE